MAMIPESIAFAFVSGVPILSALYASFILLIVTSALGGRPGSISAATGAFAVVQTSLVASYGVEYLFATLILVGILEALVGVFRLAKFIELASLPIMTGFVNGLAIVIGMAQFSAFQNVDGSWISGDPLYWMIGQVALAMLIVYFFPYLTKFIPSTLVAIGVIMAFEYGLDLGTITVGDKGSVSGSLPQFKLPNVPFTGEMIGVIFPHAIIMTIVGLMETLMLIRLIDEITETKGQPNRECVAQGLANFLCGFLGGMGGCAMIGQSIINVNSGSKGRASGMIFGGILTLSFLRYNKWHWATYNYFGCTFIY